MHRTKNDNSNLLLLGGAAAIAALLLMNQGKAADSSTSGGSGSGDLGMWGSGTPTYGSEGPTIYQLPGAGEVTFPNTGGVSLADLMALLGGGGPAPEGSTSKKDQVIALDAGATAPDGTILKKPFVSTSMAAATTPTAESKKDTAVNSQDLLTLAGAGAMAIPGALPLSMAAHSTTGLWSALSGFLNPEKTPDRFGGGNSWGAGSETGIVGVLRGTGNPGTSAAAKKEAALGFSGQYVRDPTTGLLAWNANSNSGLAELGGFGLSRDPKSGTVGAYQRDVFIGGRSGPVWNPLTGIGNPFTVADAQQGTMTYSRDLSSAEYAKALAQSSPNYVVGSYVAAPSKKEAAVVAQAPAAPAQVWNYSPGSGSAKSSGSGSSSSSKSSSSSSSSGSSSSGSFGGGSGWGSSSGGGKKGGGGAGGR